MASACFDSELTRVGTLRLLKAIPSVDAGNCFYQADRARASRAAGWTAGMTAVRPT